MEFSFLKCPITGVPTLGRASAVPAGGSQQVLYTFKPVGRAIFSLAQAIHLSRQIDDGQLIPRPDLAGLCREASENGQPPFIITAELFVKPQGNTPDTFEEKQNHFLKFLYLKGGREHKSRDIFVHDDFPLAFAGSAKEFFEIIESLISEELIGYNNSGDKLGSWPFGIRGDYYGVLPTREGKQRVKELITGPTTSLPIQLVAALPVNDLTHLHPTIQQAAGSLFASAHYPQAILAACTALDKAVQAKAQLSASTVGTALMTTAFSAKSPLIKLSQDLNEQMGFMNLYQGSVQAIRNHYAHNLTAIPATRALEWLGFVSALFYKLNEALPTATPPAS